MAKLIDSENVIAWLNAQIEKVQGGWLHDYGFPTNVIVALTDVKRFVKNLPTIEAEPVRHGRWIKIEPNGSQFRRKCSECGGIVHAVSDFCPYCGARMDATDTDVGCKGGDDNDSE